MSSHYGKGKVWGLYGPLKSIGTHFAVCSKRDLSFVNTSVNAAWLLQPTGGCHSPWWTICPAMRPCMASIQVGRGVGRWISYDFRNGRPFSCHEMIVYASTRIPRQQGNRERIWGGVLLVQLGRVRRH